MIEDDTHDLIIKAVLDYFAFNEEFQQRPAELKRRKVRKKLSEIRKLCLIRREEVLQEHIRHVKDGRAKNNPKEARAANPKNN
jgi:hypothetical protein